MDNSQVVAVINTSPDTIELLKSALERAGFIVVSTFTWAVANGQIDLRSFVATHAPSVIVYDIAPPYDRNWTLLQNLRANILKSYNFVLTTVNTSHVERLVGRDQRVYEVVGRDDDLGEIVRAVKEASRVRPTA